MAEREIDEKIGLGRHIVRGNIPEGGAPQVHKEYGPRRLSLQQRFRPMEGVGGELGETTEDDTIASQQESLKGLDLRQYEYVPKKKTPLKKKVDPTLFPTLNNNGFFLP